MHKEKLATLCINGGIINRLKRNARGGVIEEACYYTLNTTDQHAVTEPDKEVKESFYRVRRLTPVECERLMGMPDNYTNIPYRGKGESPDSCRYKALGNSFVTNVVRWIAERILKYEKGELNNTDTINRKEQ